VISKLWLAFDGKASADEKAEHTRQYVSILNRRITPPADVRRIFEKSARFGLEILSAGVYFGVDKQALCGTSVWAPLTQEKNHEKRVSDPYIHGLVFFNRLRHCGKGDETGYEIDVVKL